MLRVAPGLAVQGLLRRRPALFALALELCVPPIALLVLVCLCTVAITAAAAWLPGALWPLAAALAETGALGLVILASVARFRGWRAAALLVTALPKYLLWKLPLYAQFVYRREVHWRKTPRGGKAGEHGAGR